MEPKNLYMLLRQKLCLLFNRVTGTQGSARFGSTYTNWNTRHNQHLLKGVVETQNGKFEHPSIAELRSV